MAKKKRKRATSSSPNEDAFPYRHIRACSFCNNKSSASLWSIRWVAGPRCCDLDKIHYHCGCLRCGAKWIAGVWRKEDEPPEWIKRVVKGTDGDQQEPPAAAEG